MSELLELLTQRVRVVNGAVVDEGDAACRVEVGVSVVVSLAAVGGPAGVGYARQVGRVGGDAAVLGRD